MSDEKLLTQEEREKLAEEKELAVDGMIEALREGKYTVDDSVVKKLIARIDGLGEQLAEKDKQLTAVEQEPDDMSREAVVRRKRAIKAEQERDAAIQELGKYSRLSGSYKALLERCLEVLRGLGSWIAPASTVEVLICDLELALEGKGEKKISGTCDLCEEMSDCLAICPQQEVALCQKCQPQESPERELLRELSNAIQDTMDAMSGLDVIGWHYNGDPEAAINFFTDNGVEAFLERTAKLLGEE